MSAFREWTSTCEGHKQNKQNIIAYTAKKKIEYP